MEDVIKLGTKILFFFGYLDLVIRKFLFFFHFLEKNKIRNIKYLLKQFRIIID